MHADVANCIRHCSVCQWDKPPALPKEELHWIDKGGAPFVSWSIDTVGPFPQDEDGNCYLLIAMVSILKMGGNPCRALTTQLEGGQVPI